MTRILVIELSPAVRETVALFLAGGLRGRPSEYTQEPHLSADAAAGVDLVISGAGPAAWTAELARLAARSSLGYCCWPSPRPKRNLFPAAKSRLVSRLTLMISGLRSESLLNRTTVSVAAPAAPDAYIGFPYFSQPTARLAPRFAPVSLPVLVWGEPGCGQDRVARAMLGEAAHQGRLC